MGSLERRARSVIIPGVSVSRGLGGGLVCLLCLYSLRFVCVEGCFLKERICFFLLRLIPLSTVFTAC